MKIVFVCGSPKEDSLSAKIIEQMIPYVKGHQYGILNVDENLNRHTALQIMDMADGIVFVSPVYMGSLPSSMLGFLSDLELHMRERKARVTAIVHGDLFDTDDPMNALSIYERWAVRVGLTFMSGLGIGGCDALMIRESAFSNKHLSNGLQNCILSVINNQIFQSCTLSIGNRMAYRRMMENYYHTRMEANGVEPDTLNAKLGRFFRGGQNK